MKSGFFPPIENEATNLEYEDFAGTFDIHHRDFEGFGNYINFLSEQENSDKPPLPPILYLAAQGGGAKGAAYIGTIKAMDETGTLYELKVVAGASAGAINAFMIDLGFNSEQIEKLTKNFNFLDLFDYSGSWQTYLHKALDHSGENFYHWARALIEHVTGDEDITFAEYQTLCKANPNLKEMIFKATRLEGGWGYEQTFSAEETPDVRIVDALRASMSFPGAFKDWKVYEVIHGELRYFGTFTDGGALCNFPIESFNRKIYENPNYPRVDTKIGQGESVIPRNPCSVGLSLCSLKKLDPNITPFSHRIRMLKQDETFQPEEKGAETETTEESLNEAGWFAKSKQLMKIVAQKKFGMSPAENVREKHLAYNEQTVQIYTEETDTLEFDAAPEKRLLIEVSGYEAWMSWFQYKHAYNRTYQHDVDFNQDFFPKDGRGKLLIQPSTKEVDSHFKHIFEKYMVLLMQEASIRKKMPIHMQGEFAENQRLKFYSFHLNSLSKHYAEMVGEKKCGVILKNAFEKASQSLEDQQSLKERHAARLNEIVDENGVIELLRRYLSSHHALDHKKGERLFKAQLSNVFRLVLLSKGEILSLAVKSGSEDVLKNMLVMLDSTVKMLKEGRRIIPYDLQYFLNEVSPVSLYRNAMGKENSVKLIEILRSYNIDPIKRDGDHKNAFHYAIELGDVEALKYLVENYPKNIEPTLGHYLIQHAPFEMLAVLQSEKKLVEKITSQNAKNEEKDTLSDIAIMRYYEWKEDHKGDEKHLKILRLGTRNTLSNVAEIEGRMSHYKNRKNELNRAKKVRAIGVKAFADEIKNQKSSDLPDVPSVCEEVLTCVDEEGKEVLVSAAERKDLVGPISAMLEKIFNADKLRGHALLARKFEGKSLLYIACEYNNDAMVRLLLNYNLSVELAGPVECQSAFLAAARRDAHEAMNAILEYHKRVDLSFSDLEGSNAYHWLARSRSTKTADIWYKLFQQRDLNILNMANREGRTPFLELVNNPEGLSILKGIKKHNPNINFDDYFDFKQKPAGSYTDLELAFKTNPKLAEYVLKHVKDQVLAKEARERVRREKERDSRSSSPIAHDVVNTKLVTRYRLSEKDLFNVLQQFYPILRATHFREKNIDSYSEIRGQVNTDLKRLNRIVLGNKLRPEGDQRLEYYVGMHREENINEIVINFITQDPNMQRYLYSEFHQSGILQVSSAAFLYSLLLGFNLQVKPDKNSIYIETVSDNEIKVRSQSAFLDSVANLLSDEQPKQTDEPLCLATMEFSIKVVGEPKRIEITTPTYEIIATPGKEKRLYDLARAFFERFDQDHVYVEDVASNEIDIYNILPSSDHFNLFRIAIDHGNNSMLQRLYDAGINFNLEDDNGLTPLFYAFNNRNYELATILIGFGADPFRLNKDGISCYLALKALPPEEYEKAETLMAMIRAKSEQKAVNAENIYSHLSQVLFSNTNSDEIIRLFEDFASTIRFNNKNEVVEILNRVENGETFLHRAYMLKDPSIALFLLEKGASADIPDKYGKTFRDYWNSPKNITWRLTADVKAKRQKITEQLKAVPQSSKDEDNQRKSAIVPSLDKEKGKGKEKRTPGLSSSGDEAGPSWRPDNPRQ